MLGYGWLNNYQGHSKLGDYWKHRVARNTFIMTNRVYHVAVSPLHHSALMHPASYSTKTRVGWLYFVVGGPRPDPVKC